MTSICTCKDIPANRTAMVISPTGQVQDTYHLDCPIHGINHHGYREMVHKRVRAWVGVAQALLLRDKPGIKVIQKSPNRQTALLEWDEWDFQPIGETQNEAAETVDSQKRADPATID